MENLASRHTDEPVGSYQTLAITNCGSGRNSSYDSSSATGDTRWLGATTSVVFGFAALVGL